MIKYILFFTVSISSLWAIEPQVPVKEHKNYSKTISLLKENEGEALAYMLKIKEPYSPIFDLLKAQVYLNKADYKNAEISLLKALKKEKLF